MMLLLSQDCSNLPLIHTLYCWVLSKEVSSTIFKVFGMTQPGIEPKSHRPLKNTLPTCPMSVYSLSFSVQKSNILIFDQSLISPVEKKCTFSYQIYTFTLNPISCYSFSKKRVLNQTFFEYYHWNRNFWLKNSSPWFISLD